MTSGENKQPNVWGFSAEEKETVALFDYADNVWRVYSNVPSHITKLTKISGEVKIETVSENGNPTSINAILDKNQISFRNKSKPMSDEQRKAYAERFKIKNEVGNNHN